MNQPTIILALTGAVLAALAMISLALLRGWREWLDLRKLELASRGPEPAPSPTARIELADLKERVRKLEGIAAGVDL